MSGIAIHVENLSKQYRIGESVRHDTLRDTLMHGLRAGLARAAGNGAHDAQDSRQARRGGETFWALKDVSFEVQRGEVVGIIGRNGAGKSTLLKILSRITEPTGGVARIHGRVGSLLEVGTGFHPELTGRENVYLNGAILGMKRAEIARRFDEIVAFAEIERFLDTPVKRYSSGMYVRLAFAVAAHLEPELLIVDEVLAVGDAEFQKKCMGKMGDVASGGRTVLFVSHNMSAVQRLCTRAMLLRGGELAAWGDTAQIVNEYVASDSYGARPDQWIDLAEMSRSGTGEARFAAARFSSVNPALGCEAYSDGPLEVSLLITSDAPRAVGSIAVAVYDQYGTLLVNADTIAQGRFVALQAGATLVKLRIEQLHLKGGTYTVGLWMANATGTAFDFTESAFRFQVIAPEAQGYGVKPSRDGVVTCRFWVEEQADSEPAFTTGPGAAGLRQPSAKSPIQDSRPK